VSVVCTRPSFLPGVFFVSFQSIAEGFQQLLMIFFSLSIKRLISRLEISVIFLFLFFWVVIFLHFFKKKN